VQIVLPPLRERREDVLVIAEHMLEDEVGRSGKSLDGVCAIESASLLLHYSFPRQCR
jgi:two-component system response regulator AtoC